MRNRTLENPKKLTKRFHIRFPSEDIPSGKRIISQNLQLPFIRENGCPIDRKTGQDVNLNTLYLGRVGIRYRYTRPNICMGNTSLIVFDHKGEYLYGTRSELEDKGYHIIVFDFVQKPDLIPDLSELDSLGNELTAVFVIISGVEINPNLKTFADNLWEYLSLKFRFMVHTHILIEDVWAIGGMPDKTYLETFPDKNISFSIAVHTVSLIGKENYEIDQISDCFGITIISTLRDDRSLIRAARLLQAEGVHITEKDLLHKPENQVYVLIKGYKPCLDTIFYQAPIPWT